MDQGNDIWFGWIVEAYIQQPQIVVIRPLAGLLHPDTNGRDMWLSLYSMFAGLSVVLNNEAESLDEAVSLARSWPNGR